MLRVVPALALALLALPAHAEVALTGNFTAAEACPAYQSFNRQTNPGNVTTEPGTSYELIAGNTAEPSHFRIIVPGAQPQQRWVEVGCGTTDADVAESGAPASDDYILAVSWQPAFCETRPDKTECTTQRPDSFEASNFTLHGLWPQPNGTFYCGVSARDEAMSKDSNRWLELEELDLPADLRADLNEVMPGNQSGLDRYEWIKHGSCYGTDEEEYYADSLALMESLNASGVAALFADNVGQRLTSERVRAAFDTAFGPGAGQRVDMRCASDGNRQIITELFIAVTGNITSAPDMAALIAAAPPGGNRCPAGVVDAVGLQ